MTSNRHPAIAATVVVVLALGVFLRLLGYFDPGLQLWLDEASWAEMLVDGTGTWIRPAGYMTVSRWLVSIVNNEQMLRSLSLVGGLITLVMTSSVFLRTTKSAAVAVFGMFLLAIQPDMIAMAKEFKPYALETAFHAALIFFVVRWLAEHRDRDLHGFLLVSVLSPLFAWSVVFAFPGLFLLIGLDAWRGQRRRDLVKGFVGGVVTLGVLVAIFAMRLAGENEKAGFWGKKYDVFYVGKDIVEGWLWGLQKTVEIAGFPGRLALGLPDTLTTTIEPVLPIVCAVVVLSSTLALLVRRRWTTLAIWALPWVVTLVFNMIGKWPYGVFRTNIYLLIYTLGLLVHGLDLVAARTRSSSVRRVGVVVLAAIAALVAPWNLDHFRIKEARYMSLSSSMRTALEQIAATAPTSTAAPMDVALDGHACGMFRYYARVHGETRTTIGSTFAHPRFNVGCGGFTEQRWLKRLDKLYGDVAWVVVGKPPFLDFTRAALAERCSEVTETALTATWWFRCVPKNTAVPATLPKQTIPTSTDADAGEAAEAGAP